MNELITRIEEHVIELQDEAVKHQDDRHASTIRLLREAKDAIIGLEEDLAVEEAKAE